MTSVIIESSPRFAGRRLILLVAAVLCLNFVASGCTVNRVSLLKPTAKSQSIDSGDVRVYSNFSQIDKAWKLKGMISTYTLPIGSNSREKRKALIKKEAANLGVNAVVGLQENVGKTVGQAPRSIGLLAKAGNSTADGGTLPKFVTCFPPVDLKSADNASTNRLDYFLRDFIQFFFGYRKGYYVYQCKNAGSDHEAIINGNIEPARLEKEIGIMPDYVLLTSVDGYDATGSAALYQTKTLTITMRLFDLSNGNITWERTTEGIATSSIMGTIFASGLVGMAIQEAAREKGAEDIETIRKALVKAMDVVPAVPGFQGGFVAPMYRN